MSKVNTPTVVTLLREYAQRTALRGGNPIGQRPTRVPASGRDHYMPRWDFISLGEAKQRG
jgi:hypothetical protein